MLDNLNNILVEKAANVVASPLANSTLSAMLQLVPLTSVTNLLSKHFKGFISKTAGMQSKSVENLQQ